MYDIKNEDDLRKAVTAKIEQIGNIITPDPAELDGASNKQAFMAVLTGVAALTNATTGYMESLTEANLIPQDLGRVLIKQARQLTEDVQKAMSAQLTLDAAKWEEENADPAEDTTRVDGNVTKH